MSVMQNKKSTELKIQPGLVEAEVNDTPARTYRIQWAIPLFTEEKRSELLQAFAADALLAGRWAAGIAEDQDQTAAEAAESGWQSNCECGRPQPCRHANTVLFRFREKAKENAWLWLETRGIQREGTFEAVQQLRYRKQSNQARTGQGNEVINLADENRGPQVSPILAHAEDPPFWNRDISFAEWLSHIYTSVKRGDVI